MTAVVVCQGEFFRQAHPLQRWASEDGMYFLEDVLVGGTPSPNRRQRGRHDTTASFVQKSFRSLRLDLRVLPLRFNDWLALNK